MAVIDKRVHRFAAFARKQIVLSVASIPINQAQNTIMAMCIPYQGFPAGQPPYAIRGWYVERCDIFCTAVTANASAMGLVGPIGAQNALKGGTVAFVAGTIVNIPITANLLSVTPFGRVGKLGDSIAFGVATDGTGTVTNATMVVTIRPFPMADEAA